MAISTITIKDGNAASQTLAVDNTNSVVTPIHLEDATQRAALVAAVTAIVTAINSAVYSPAIQPVSATALPLPTGAATNALQTTANASLATIATSIGGTLKVDTVVASTAANRSGTITTGGTAQTLMAANTNRRGFVIQNNSSGALYINGLGTATSDGLSLTIPAGTNAIYETSVQHTGTGAVSILGATTGQAFYAREF